MNEFRVTADVEAISAEQAAHIANRFHIHIRGLLEPVRRFDINVAGETVSEPFDLSSARPLLPIEPLPSPKVEAAIENLRKCEKEAARFIGYSELGPAAQSYALGLLHGAALEVLRVFNEAKIDA